MTIHHDGGACYARTNDGRRTRLFISIAAALQAAEQGETYDDEEYCELVKVDTTTPPTHRRRIR